MKTGTKSFVLGVAAAAFCITAVFASGGIKSAEFNQNKVVFDGKALDLSKQPMVSIVKDNETNISNYIPIRGVLEEMGYNITWDSQTKTVHIASKNDEAASANSETIELIFKADELSDDDMRKITGKSYKPGESLPASELRILTLTYIDYEGKTQHGQMIVNKDVSQEVTEIFKELYDAKFPIEKIRLIDEYNADDDLSMKDNNSSAYNHRVVAGTSTLSNHAKGLAIDINPLYNPYVKGGFISPEEGAKYAKRTLPAEAQGMIFKGDACYNAFVKRGWVWGGDWASPKDYQHFEKTR